jgi:predicted RNA-binding Zn-ribbon protein involved in translation (DUF1610 family)
MNTAVNAQMVFCRGCGGQMHETAHACPSCGAARIVIGPFRDGDGNVIDQWT